MSKENGALSRLEATEAQFQRLVIEYAQLRGWMVQHTRPAIRQSGRWSTPIQGDPGFPDLVLARGGRVVFAELKSRKGRVRPEQWEWIDAINGGLPDGEGPAFVWRPSDWLRVEEVLR